MKKGLFIFILCLSIMLIGCPGMTSNDANNANGTNTGSNDGNGNGGSGNSGGSGNNGGSGTGNTGNTGVITSVENEFVYYDNEKECYVGSVTWKADNSTKEKLLTEVTEIRFNLYDVNGTERGYIPVKTDPDYDTMSVTGEVQSKSKVMYNDYGWVVKDIPGIKVEARIYFKDNKPALITEQNGLRSKGSEKNPIQDLTTFSNKFITEDRNNEQFIIFYKFNWNEFISATRIIPISVKLSSMDVTGSVTTIDWSDENILDCYFNGIGESTFITVSNFFVKWQETDEYDDNYNKKRIFTLNGDGDKSVDISDAEAGKISMTVVSTTGKSYKFTTYQRYGSVNYDNSPWTYQE